MNYPDVLGYITGGPRVNISVVQVAMGITPRVVRAGRPFEVNLLIQNASDADVDVTATLKLPERDAKRQSNRFVAKSERLVIGLQPAETGCLVLPVTTLRTTAVGSDYRINVEIKVNVLSKTKPRRVRAPAGGAAISLEHLPEEQAEEIERLKALSFSAENSKLLGASIGVPFSVISGSIGEIPDLQAGWKSVWTLKDYMDDSLLLEKYRSVLKTSILPGLDRRTAFKPIMKEMKTLFEGAGFALKPIEALFITKLLTLMLEYSSPTYGTGTQLTAGMYNILPVLDKTSFEDGVNLPKWVGAILRAVHQDARVADYPVQGVIRFALEGLLRDSMTRAFEMVEMATGESLGTEEERNEYIDHTLDLLLRDKGMTFSRTYMPLILGGIVVYDMVMVDGENIGDLLHEMRSIIDRRSDYRNDDTDPIFKIAAKLVDQAITKYGTGNKYW